MNDEPLDTGQARPGQEAAMQDVAANRDRAHAEAEAKRAQSKPASSGQLNPGAEEYRALQPKGPGGTGGALNSGVPEHPQKTSE